MMTIVRKIKKREVKQFGNNALDKGFTIVEALISIILFTIILTGGINIYVTASRITALATHKRLAVENANTKVEEIRAYLNGLRPISIAVFETEFPEGPPVPESVNLGLLPASRSVTYTNFGAGPDYKEINVNITWTEVDQTGPRQISLTSIIIP